MVILYLVKPKKWFNQGRDGRQHATVVDCNALKEFKQQFNPIHNTREEQMASSGQSYQTAKALCLDNQHILDTFKLGLPSNIYVKLAHIDGMQATLNIAIPKRTSTCVSSMSNIPLMVASSHYQLASGIYQKPDIPKQVTFQDSALLSGLQKINRKLKSLENDLYALRAEKNKRSKREYKEPGREMFTNRNRSRGNTRHSSRNSQDRDEKGMKKIQ